MTRPLSPDSEAEAMPAAPAPIVREYGPFPNRARVAGVTFDGESVWFAAGDCIQSFDPQTGEAGRALAVAADAGTAYDGRHLFQIAGGTIQKIDPHTGQIAATIPAPAGAAGLTWAEGALWVARYNHGAICQIEPETGRVVRTLETARFVTGVTWLGDALWHGTWEGEQSELRRIDSTTGAVLERLTMPTGTGVSGVESDGRDSLFCGAGKSGKIRSVRVGKPERARAAR